MGALAMILIGLATGCGKDNDGNSNGGGNGGNSTVSRSTIKRNFESVNGMPYLSYVFIAFDPADPAATVTEIEVQRNLAKNKEKLTSSAVVGRLDQNTIDLLTFDSDPDNDRAQKATLMQNFAGQLFVYLDGVPEDLATGANEFTVTFNSKGAAKSFTLQTKGN